MSRAPITGSLAFAERDGILYSSGSIGGRVALVGPLSESMVALGVGLTIGSGSRHWLNEVATGDLGVFLPGDQHDALYAPGSLYATVTLTAERLEETAARAGLVLDARTLGGTGVHARRVMESRLAGLRAGFERGHAGQSVPASRAGLLGDSLLDVVVAHFGRPPHPAVGRTNPQGLARIVARARAYVIENLEDPISVDAMAAAAFTSRRTLHRAFNLVLDETPKSYVRKLRLHRIRRDLASEAEAACTIALVANRWGIGEPAASRAGIATSSGSCRPRRSPAAGACSASLRKGPQDWQDLHRSALASQGMLPEPIAWTEIPEAGSA